MKIKLVFLSLLTTMGALAIELAPGYAVAEPEIDTVDWTTTAIETLYSQALALGSSRACPGGSLRPMTYDTALLATGGSSEDVSVMDDVERARRIDLASKQAPRDLVILQEVYSDDAREEQTLQLEEEYPYVASKLDADDFDEDSDLVQVSRFPFAKRPNPQFRRDNVDASEPGGRFHDVRS